MRKTIARGRKVTKRVAAAYATYEATTKSYEKIADKHFHTWTLDTDYTSQAHDKAIDHLVEKHLPKLLKGRMQQDSYERVSPIPKTWTPLPVPGARLLEIKKDGCYVYFRSPRAKTIASLQRRLDELEKQFEEDQPEVVFDPNAFRVNVRIRSWTEGEWNYGRARASRSFDSVILPSELQAAIEDDLERFSSSRDRLRRIEMPWRRGYLLTGPPGTGKTSVSLAIAGCLGFNVARLSLSEIKDDGDLHKAISHLDSSTVLVIEDIDAYAVSRDRNHSQQDGALSLSGLLNSLDGFETPDGLVTIVTTNHPEHLDEALVRPGRLDRIFTLDYIDGPELERLYTWFYEGPAPETAPLNTRDAQLSPAQVAEIFKQHLESPEDGWKAALALIPSKAQIVADRRLGLIAA